MSSALGLSIGAMELGVLISSVLYGVTTVQVYIYHKNSIHDSLLIRALVGRQRSSLPLVCVLTI